MQLEQATHVQAVQVPQQQWCCGAYRPVHHVKDNSRIVTSVVVDGRGVVGAWVQGGGGEEHARDLHMKTVPHARLEPPRPIELWARPSREEAPTAIEGVPAGPAPAAMATMETTVPTTTTTATRKRSHEWADQQQNDKQVAFASFAHVASTANGNRHGCSDGDGDGDDDGENHDTAATHAVKRMRVYVVGPMMMTDE